MTSIARRILNKKLGLIDENSSVLNNKLQDILVNLDDCAGEAQRSARHISGRLRMIVDDLEEVLEDL